MGKKIPFNPVFKNCRATIFNQDGTCETYKVADVIDGNHLELEHIVLNVSDSKQLFDTTTGGIHYYFNMDMPAKVEANNLSVLRRSMAIKNLFSYDVAKNFDMFKLLPWVVIILLVLFK